ncbi:MAG: phosphotriesterase [Eubacteriales bacterium]|nr:phosphotriesterase [Eubacteriales bacterium]
MKKGKIHFVNGAMARERELYFQSHEHLWISPGRSGEVNSALCIDDYQKSLCELQGYRKSGGEAIADAQPVGCGRMAKQLYSLSVESQVEILASTGFHKMIFYPEEHWIFRLSEDKLAELYIKELTEGMYQDPDNIVPVTQTSVKAGQIKTALEAEKMSAQYHKMFSAAAYAAVETGAPLMVHVENGCSPETYFEFLLKKNVKPEQMIFCHMDRACADMGIHKAVAEAGVFLEYDTIAREKYHSDEREIEIFCEMADAGFEDALLFSLDTTRQRLQAYGGSVGLDYILRVFLKKMQKNGIPQSMIRKISKENPSRAFRWLK